MCEVTFSALTPSSKARQRNRLNVESSLVTAVAPELPKLIEGKLKCLIKAWLTG